MEHPVRPPVYTLFLDFDGVLHKFGEPALDEYFRLLPNPNLFCWLPILEGLLAPYPEVRIIVSSDWRYIVDNENLVKLLGPLGGRFAGIVENYQSSRALEILLDARRRGLQSWLAVDDHPTVAEAALRDPRFIVCAPATGLSAAGVQLELTRKLAGLGTPAS